MNETPAPRITEIQQFNRLLSFARQDIHAELPIGTPQGIIRERRYLLLVDALAGIGQREHDQEILGEERGTDYVLDALLKAAPYVEDHVNSHFPTHLLTTSVWAKKLAQSVGLPANIQQRIQVEALLHDVGTFLDPTEYLRKDFLGQTVLKSDKVAFPREFRAELPDIPYMLGIRSSTLFDVPIENREQTRIIQAIVNVADNLGKYGEDGILFSKQTMQSYAARQPGRYSGDSRFITTRRGHQALNDGKQQYAIQLVLEEIAWLEDLGVDFEHIGADVHQTVQQPENQRWIHRFQEAMQTLEQSRDMELARPPITTILFDVGNVLLTAPDDILVQRIAESLHTDPKTISQFFADNNTLAVGGKTTEETYLRKLYDVVGQPFPSTIDEARLPFEHPDLYQPVAGMQDLMAKIQENPSVCIIVQSDIVPSLRTVVLQKLKEYYPNLPVERIHFSCDMKESKKENGAPAYQWIIDAYGITMPETVLVVDDTVKYVDTASAKYAMRRHHFRVSSDGENPGSRLARDLFASGILLS